MEQVSKSADVVIRTEVLVDGYHTAVIAYASFQHEGETKLATVSKSFDSFKARELKGVTVEDATEALKREALRELVTQLNLHGVL